MDGKGLRGIRGDSIYFPAVSRKRNISKAIVFGVIPFWDQGFLNAKRG
jgi:hypothetical protein